MAQYLNMAGVEALWAKIKNTFALKSHTHNYAGSSSAGGTANTVVVGSGSSDVERNIVCVNGSSLYYGVGITMNYSKKSITATTFKGNLTGNVTGNVTGNCTGSSSSCTGNAVTATTASKLNTVSKTAWGQTYWTSGGVPTNISGSLTSTYFTLMDRSSNPYLKLNDASYICYVQLLTDGALALGSTSTKSLSIAQNGNVTAFGSVTATAFYQSSDERLKTFHDPIKVDLDKLKTLRKNYFNFNDSDKLEIGVSAQEIQSLYPEIVSTNDEGYLSVAYDKLSVITLSAIDELHEENKQLKSENDELKKRIEAIENILNKLTISQ